MKIIILDRDGVINEDSDEYIKSPEEWIPISSSLEAIAQLNKAGFKVIIASNQSGLARGYFDEVTLEQIHQKMKNMLAEYHGYIDHIYICPHSPTANCICRKPKPGMFHQIKHDFKLTDQDDIYAVGDSLRDIEAARGTAQHQFLVLTGKGARLSEQEKNNLQETKILNNLFEVVSFILKEQGDSLCKEIS